MGRQWLGDLHLVWKTRGSRQSLPFNITFSPKGIAENGLLIRERAPCRSFPLPQNTLKTNALDAILDCIQLTPFPSKKVALPINRLSHSSGFLCRDERGQVSGPYSLSPGIGAALKHKVFIILAHPEVRGGSCMKL